MEAETMEINVAEHLTRKGAVGLLALLHENGEMMYSEIESEIGVTSSTITARRDEAVELGLLNLSLGKDEHGTKHVYHLTDMGEALAEKLEREGAVHSYLTMRNQQQFLERQTREVIEWVENNPSQLLEFDRATEGYIVRDDVDEDTDRFETDLDKETAMHDEYLDAESSNGDSSDGE